MLIACQVRSEASTGKLSDTMKVWNSADRERLVERCMIQDGKTRPNGDVETHFCLEYGEAAGHHLRHLHLRLRGQPGDPFMVGWRR